MPKVRINTCQSQEETKTFQAARFTFFMSTFLARLSSNLMEFRSFFSLSENRLSWSAEVPWWRLVWDMQKKTSMTWPSGNRRRYKTYPEIASISHPGSSMGNSGSLQERQVVPGPENPTKERAGVETRPVGGLRSIWSPRRPGSGSSRAGNPAAARR